MLLYTFGNTTSLSRALTTFRMHKEPSLLQALTGKLTESIELQALTGKLTESIVGLSGIRSGGGRNKTSEGGHYVRKKLYK